MEIDALSNLVNALEKTSFSKIEVKIDNLYLNLQKPDTKLVNDTSEYIAAGMVTEKNINESQFKESEEELGIEAVKSPMVGVFYRSSSPEAEVFVKEGDTIKKGDVIGVIEAMKLINEVTSEFDGEVVEVCCENKTNVEYGQPLVKIKIK
ncbi:MAG: hypothetical protein K5986_11005 [Clostridium sp.]|uniref:acetyl-CoA carboxylase biotin carboxyl carrier protein n=1 Tax=Clostridium sp. DSM 8431 TaxID=1761781 RepID=UPI0008E0D263|nr:biotin/lipoyl-containing protein [Clostridium sp. DSM 8431]MCR4944942.1 hypothetical protein [Clostridium sp.]SFU76086.1 acetyl-CoA carboxylase biotin carboxyl carrier protein [Clostridium sp. DSM 8431]